MKALFSILLLGICSLLYAQNRELEIVNTITNKVEYSSIVSDSLSAIQEGRKWLSELHDQSYLTASIDSSYFASKKIIFYVDPGQAYKWARLSKGNIAQNDLPVLDPSDRLFLNRPFNAEQLSSFFDNAIDYYENRGYPFASIRLDSLEIEDNEISAALNVQKNKYYIIDSILIKGKSGINRDYLLQYLGLEEGMPYPEDKIKEISIRIQEIPFVEEKKKQEVLFFEKGVKLIIHLKKKNASRFDGVLGLLTNEDNGRIELTGDVDLNLINPFNRGEEIGFNWRKLKGNNQDLKIDFAYPYLFGSQLGIDFNFKLFKRDTTFLDLISRFGVNYLLRRGELFTLFLENKSSSLLTRNRFLNQTSATAPALGDVRINSFGIAYEFNRLDYRFNPRKGVFLKTYFSVGRKKLLKIPALEDENPNVYDGIDLNTTQYNGLLDLHYYLPLGNRSTLKMANLTATNYAENIYQNELLRIGGLKLLRGFDEESINASTYSIFTLEYRFLLDRNSYFSLFSDGGYYENRNVESFSKDTPFGMGTGISFETNAGIFSFNYAVGRQFGNPIEFRAAKIHFGFVNFF